MFMNYSFVLNLHSLILNVKWYGFEKFELCSILNQVSLWLQRTAV